MSERRIGRATFLSVVGAGGIGILFGDRITSALHRPIADAGSVVPAAIKEVFPSGWRIYAINPPWRRISAAWRTRRSCGCVAWI